ncbi:MAG: exo-alpha-sialidase, partial [Verrucomicrobiaceae bacterium]|nr:exo-alpha-sialidase [Verrucomicrobiaceae bacterium]
MLLRHFCFLIAVTAAASAAPPPTTLPGKTSECAARLTPANPPNDGLVFVDHSAKRRSGHLGHALVQLEPGKLIAFYPNCSGDNGGHSGVGWMEFKRSLDGGKTWGEPQVLSFSKKLHEKKMGRSAMAEKAIVTDKGEIVLFYLICDVSKNALWQPYWEPLVSKSTDAGMTWSEPKPVCSSRGRIYDAEYHDGEIRVLHFANDAEKDWRGNAKEHVYELHVSTDGCETFTKRSELPFITNRRGYGALGRLNDGGMIAYIYNSA